RARLDQRAELAVVRRHRGLGRHEQPALPAARVPDAQAALMSVALVTATLRTDGGRERVALNTAYARALLRAGVIPLAAAPLLDPGHPAHAPPPLGGPAVTGGADGAPARLGGAPPPRPG